MGSPPLGELAGAELAGELVEHAIDDPGLVAALMAGRDALCYGGGMAVFEKHLVRRGSSAERAKLVDRLRLHAREIHALGVTSLALFGSRVRGGAREDSDLDVLIEYDRRRPFTLVDLARIKLHLEKIVGLEVHLSTRDGFAPHRLRQVMQDAVQVF
jgi:uncharacterized protein